MTTMSSRKSLLVATMASMYLLAAQAGTVPLDLPNPDGNPGNLKKPVKVYILAGQSNMVGMGDISGARPAYSSVFLMADPAVIPGPMPVGGSALARHGVFDAKAVVYSGKEPVKTVPIALGTVAEKLPATDSGQSLEVTAQIDVPVTGIYTLHAGFEDSSYSVVLLDGKEVYRRDAGGQPVVTKVALEVGKRYPVRISYLKGRSAAFWMEQVDIEANGDLMTVVTRDKKFQYLVDEAGKWTARNDVLYADPRLFPARNVLPLSATANNGKSIGPEMGYGHVMGSFHDEQVLLIKTAMGNRSLNFDFRPPSSGRTDPQNNYESYEYRAMIEGVSNTLAKIDQIVPGYSGQGYEIAGFGWFQGHKDKGSTKEEYEKHLVNLINDLRKDFSVPNMPAVVATVGFGGYRLQSGPWKGVWEAQMAVGDPKQHPEFAGTVASVDTRDFWREREESPKSEDYHYHRNAETYLLVGEAMGRAMVRLEGGEAERIPTSGRESSVAALVAAEASTTAPTDVPVATPPAILKPLLLDGVRLNFIADAAKRTALQAAVNGQKPTQSSQFLNDPMDGLVAIYKAADITDYNWKPFGQDLNNVAWDYFSFDPPEVMEKTKADRYRRVTVPAGMTNWFAPEFDAAQAGWKQGLPPFGQKNGKLEPTGSCTNNFCLCGVPPRTLWEKEVLLARGTFEFPALKPGYRYRFVVGGSDHVMTGEGYAIYINGRLLAESKNGVPNRCGGQPRGGHVYADLQGEFKGGKVTVAATSFLQFYRKDREIPPQGHFTLWMEEQKLPPVDEYRQ